MARRIGPFTVGGLSDARLLRGTREPELLLLLRGRERGVVALVEEPRVDIGVGQVLLLLKVRSRESRSITAKSA